MNRPAAASPKAEPARTQRGGFLAGLLVGLLIGVAVSLAVALYVTKVPVPFVDKLPQRTPEQDAAEAARNKNWDPNTPLSGKTPPPAKAASAPPSAPAAEASAPARAASAPAPARDPAAILSGQPGADGSKAPATVGSARPDPIGLYVQAGAFARADDAEQQRAKLALMGLSARISEREQGGRIVYRVRIGPFDSRDDAAGVLDRLQGAGIETTVVRVERSATP